jgi:hypothetical protein
MHLVVDSRSGGYSASRVLKEFFANSSVLKPKGFSAALRLCVKKNLAFYFIFSSAESNAELGFAGAAFDPYDFPLVGPQGCGPCLKPGSAENKFLPFDAHAFDLNGVLPFRIPVSLKNFDPIPHAQMA